MGLKGLCTFFAHRLFEFSIVILLILLLPNLPPYAKFSEPFSVAPFKPFEGKLALNEKLNDVEQWHKGDFIGPEGIAEYNGELYVSLYGGDIVKLTGNHITPIVKTGKPCKGHFEERICGRPLGIAFDASGTLYVADAYYGIFKVNVKTGEKTFLISTDTEINGKKPKIPNSITLASNGDFYWTDSSTEFVLENGIFDMLADPSGRLIHYNAKTHQNTVLMEKLHFANGVQLSDDEEFLIVAETARNRIHRYYLKGAKKGTSDIFIDGLPGMPDNLKPDGKGGFLAALVLAVDADHPSPFQAIGPFPILRKLVARIMGLVQLGFEVINKIYPCDFAAKGVHFIGHFSSTTTLITPARATVLHLSRNGEILDSLHSLNKTLGMICDAHISKDTLYLGSPFNDYIGRIPLAKIGWTHLTAERKKRDVPVEQPTTTQRPTTTTQPPTTTTTTPRPTTTTTPRPTTTPPPTTTTTTRPPTTTTPPPPTTTTTRPSTTTTQRPTATTTTQRPATTTTQRPATTTSPRSPTTTPTPQAPVKPAPQAAPSPSSTTPSTPQQKTSVPPKQQTQQAPPPKQQSQQAPPSKTPPAQKQAPPAAEKATAPPAKQSPPPVAQPVRDQPKSVPVGDAPKTRH